MKTVVEKLANSLALRIPKAFVQQAKVKNGRPVRVTVRKSRMIVTALETEQRSLKKLLTKVTLENTHKETDWVVQWAKRFGEFIPLQSFRDF